MGIIRFGLNKGEKKQHAKTALLTVKSLIHGNRVKMCENHSGNEVGDSIVLLSLVLQRVSLYPLFAEPGRKNDTGKPQAQARVCA